MDILSALNTLKSATAESLQHHHEEVLSTLATVKTLLGIQSFKDVLDEGSSMSTGYFDTSFEVSDRSDDGDIVEDDPVPDTLSYSLPQLSPWPMKLLETYRDDARWLYDYCLGNKTGFPIIKKRGQKDKRMEDIRRIEGDPLAKEEDNILRALAQRSLGNLYTKIQRDAELEQTRVDELCESICSSDPTIRSRIHRRTNFISKHIERFSHDPDDKDDKKRQKVMRSINLGVKRLVVEKLFSQRLSQFGQAVEFPGISAFTALQVKAFDGLRLEDIPRFLDYVFSCKVDLPIDFAAGGSRTMSVQLSDFFVGLSPWFYNIQDEYDKDYYPPQEWASAGVALEHTRQHSLRLCSMFMQRNGATPCRMIEDENLTEGQTENGGPLIDRADSLQPPTQPTTSYMVENMTVGHITSRSTPTLLMLRDDAHTGSAAPAAEKVPRLAQKRLRDENNMETELSRKRSTAFPVSSGQTKSTRSLSSQVQAIDSRGCVEISRLINPPESATENLRDQRTGEGLRPIQSYSNLGEQEHVETEAFSDVFDPRQTAQLILPPDFGLLEKQTEHDLSHISDPRQTVESVHLPEYFGLQADGADNSFPDMFDPRQTAQPIHPSALFSLGERGADDEFNLFDPRQTAQLILPPDLGLEGKQTEDDLSQIFDPRQTVQPVHPPECLSLQPDGAAGSFPDIFDPRDTVQPVHPSECLSLQSDSVAGSLPDIFDPRQTVQPVHLAEYSVLQADGAGIEFPDMFERWHTAQLILPSSALESQSRSGHDTLKSRRELQRERNVHNHTFPFVDLAAHCS